MEFPSSQLHVFPNGLKLVYHHSPGTVSHCGLMILAGGRNEPDGKVGLAHFIEHVIFKGTKKRNAFQVLNRLESVGGELNGYTTKEETCIHASMLHLHFERAVELIADIVLNPSFPDKEIAVEKGVVLDEINSYLDNPSEQIFEDFEAMVFKGHPVGNPILGTETSVRSFSRKDLLEFTKLNYISNRMVFSYVGALPLGLVVDVVESNFKVRGKDSKILKQAAGLRRLKPVNKVLQRPTAHDHFICGGRAYGSKSPKRFALFLLNNILGGPGMNSRLNLKIREKYGYTYQIESSYNTFSDCGIFSIYFATDPVFFSRCRDLVWKEVHELQRNRISKIKLHSYKYQLKGQIAIAQENRPGFMLNNARNVLLYGRPMDLVSVMKGIDGVTSNEIMDVANEIANTDQMSSLHYKSSTDRN
ncbi:MAG: M16 family metallopeptidase [Bacteroidota bacterium]|jgi:predicted Zn-dependent peptidase